MYRPYQAAQRARPSPPDFLGTRSFFTNGTWRSLVLVLGNNLLCRLVRKTGGDSETYSGVAYLHNIGDRFLELFHSHLDIDEYADSLFSLACCIPLHSLFVCSHHLLGSSHNNLCVCRGLGTLMSTSGVTCTQTGYPMRFAESRSPQDSGQQNSNPS